MYDLITNNYKGSTITLGITGLPIIITGEVITSPSTDLINLRLSDGGLTQA